MTQQDKPTKATTKASKLRTKRDRRADDLPDLAPIPRREANGQRSRAGRKRGPEDASEAAMLTRCRHRGVAAGPNAIRDSRSPWWGCHAGRAMAGISTDHAERLDLWDAIQHMRRVTLAYDRACAAPRRHAECLRLMAPTDRMEATADTPAMDLRDEADRDRAAVAAWMQIHGWLACVDRAASAEAWRVVVDDAPAHDAAGLIAALRCVDDGRSGRVVVYRARRG